MRLVFWLASLSLAALAWAQGTREDYERALSLGKRIENRVTRSRVVPQWLPDNHRFWYRNALGRDAWEFVWVDAGQGTRTPAVDHAQLAAALSARLGKTFAAERLPIDRLEPTDDPQILRFRAEGKRWQYHREQKALSEEPAAGPGPSGLEADWELRPSTETGPETSLTFANQTEGPVRLFWLEPGGDRRAYGTVEPGERREQHTFTGHRWLALNAEGLMLGVFEARETGGEVVLRGPGRPLAPTRTEGRRRRSPRPEPEVARSPDGRWGAFVRDHNLWVRTTVDGTEFALTEDGTLDHAYRLPAYWSPDAKKLVVLRTRPGEGRKINLIESSPKDQLQPRLHTLDYDKPGDRMPVSKPYLFDVAQRRPIPVPEERFPEPWSLTELRWAPDSSRFTFLYNQRGHQVLRLLAVDAPTGDVHTLIDESSPTFIDYSGKFFLHHAEPAGDLIWMSERSGWNHLYRFDAATGLLKNPITAGEWVVRRVEHVDDTSRQIWFEAGGLQPEQDPYYVHLCRVNFDGTDLVVLTEGDGTHEVTFSPDRRFFLDRWSRVDQPPITELRRASDGQRLCRLEEADDAALRAEGWRRPERFIAKGRDGKTDIYGVIYRPAGFDPSRKYPVIEEIYAGPQGAFVPKAFGLQNRQHALAELGFIVVQIDGMGTSGRSKAFHDVCWKNLGDSGFPDRIAWLRAAATAHPAMDLARVGIYGGSAGGQSALRALLAHGDFYHVAVADCGCHDNRMDKIWWNELWMGWPLGPHYEEQSNVTQAHRLQGKLLLTVGELDRNVDPASTLQVVNALIQAEKDFDLILVPGAGHGVGESPYMSRRRMDFFVRHLLGVEPRR